MNYAQFMGTCHESQQNHVDLKQTIELKDPLTKAHCDRMATCALRIAETLGLDEVTRRDIRYGSWLHDCGKIGVPENILNAQRLLTDDEKRMIWKHPIRGTEVVRKANRSPAVQNIILYHHERFDGKRYPTGSPAWIFPWSPVS